MSSAAQATCSKCGATMLATTAARTGGICMAYKQGIRQHIEDAKVYYQQQRQPDPFRDFWVVLVRRVYSAPDGFYRLSHSEQTYYLATVLQGETFNGGIVQFFENSSGDFYRETLDALQELGAIRCHALLVAAK
jgi:lipoprotein NlpI